MNHTWSNPSVIYKTWKTEAHTRVPEHKVEAVSVGEHPTSLHFLTGLSGCAWLFRADGDPKKRVILSEWRNSDTPIASSAIQEHVCDFSCFTSFLKNGRKYGVIVKLFRECD